MIKRFYKIHKRFYKIYNKNKITINMIDTYFSILDRIA